MKVQPDSTWYQLEIVDGIHSGKTISFNSPYDYDAFIKSITSNSQWSQSILADNKINLSKKGEKIVLKKLENDKDKK